MGTIAARTGSRAQPENVLPMSRREPSDVAILAARLMRAWPSLSPYSCASLADELCSIERAQRRHAERQCSGADGGYVRAVRVATWLVGRRVEHCPEAEQRAARRIDVRCRTWRLAVFGLLYPDSGATDSRTLADLADIKLQGDPRGRVLLLRLPGEQEASTV